MKEYNSLPDEYLVGLSRNGDEQATNALIVRYLRTVRIVALGYNLRSFDHDDMVQEGLLGLMKAIRLYSTTKGSFATFATVCIKSSIISVARSDNSQKNIPLHNYASLDECELELVDNLSLDPQQAVMVKEQAGEIWAKIYTILTPIELRALRLFLTGHSYNEISLILAITCKAVDNALQRVRRKLQSVI